MGGIRLYVLLILAVLISGLVAMLPLALTGSDILESSYREYAVRDMTANAGLFALALEKNADSRTRVDLGDLARTARAGSDTRFTLIARDGAVLADSDETADRMENHGNRPEIREALDGRTGVDIRHSPTLGTEWIYVAMPLADGNIVRAAASLDELNGRLWQWWKRAIVGFGASIVVLAVLALLIARALSRPLEVAASGADRYAKGEFSYRLPSSGSAEMRRLSQSLSAMAAELDARFRLINRQRGEMRTVFENMSEGVLAVDTQGRIMLLNKTAERLLHFTKGAENGTIESAVRNAELQDILREAAADSPLEREIRVQDDAGGEALVHVHASRILENGAEAGVLAVLRDVTRLRQLEIMHRDFVANVSHELRTPITTVQGCLETLLDDGLDDRESAERFLEMALRNARRMGAIVGNLLFLAGMESGTNINKEKAVVRPVRPAIDEALDLCREDARARGIAFDVTCEENLSAMMNPQLVVHALVNLVDNAVKYGPEGGTIRISAHADGDRTHITVADKGPGIAPRHQSRVFERFYRIDGSTRMKKGSGLGLALVKHIALAQGGDIKLESEIGAGSAFKLILPRE